MNEFARIMRGTGIALLVFAVPPGVIGIYSLSHFVLVAEMPLILLVSAAVMSFLGVFFLAAGFWLKEPREERRSRQNG